MAEHDALSVVLGNAVMKTIMDDKMKGEGEYEMISLENYDCEGPAIVEESEKTAKFIAESGTTLRCGPPTTAHPVSLFRTSSGVIKGLNASVPLVGPLFPLVESEHGEMEALRKSGSSFASMSMRYTTPSAGMSSPLYSSQTKDEMMLNLRQFASMGRRINPLSKYYAPLFDTFEAAVAASASGCYTKVLQCPPGNFVVAPPLWIPTQRTAALGNVGFYLDFVPVVRRNAWDVGAIGCPLALKDDEEFEHDEEVDWFDCDDTKHVCLVCREHYTNSDTGIKIQCAQCFDGHCCISCAVSMDYSRCPLCKIDWKSERLGVRESVFKARQRAFEQRTDREHEIALLQEQVNKYEGLEDKLEEIQVDLQRLQKEHSDLSNERNRLAIELEKYKREAEEARKETLYFTQELKTERERRSVCEDKVIELTRKEVCARASALCGDIWQRKCKQLEEQVVDYELALHRERITNKQPSAGTVTPVSRKKREVAHKSSLPPPKAPRRPSKRAALFISDHSSSSESEEYSPTSPSFEP